MSHDPLDAGIARGQPVFLPAFQITTIGDISNPSTERSMFPGAKELNWYDPDNEHWHYCVGLYSLGQSSLDLKDPNERILTQRDRSRTLLIADSGGYQLGHNTFKAIKEEVTPRFLQSEKYNDVRKSVLKWMEAYADYGLIIDFPAWAIGEPKFIFSEFKDCLRETRRNMEFFRDNLSGDTPLKLLSVIQGRDIWEAINWYDSVKNVKCFPYSGWSFAGPVVKDTTITIKMILLMLREGRVNQTENWIHLLGRGSPTAIFVFTILQQCLDEFIGQNIRISFDVSNPFLMGGRYAKTYKPIDMGRSGYTMPSVSYSDIKSLIQVVRTCYPNLERPLRYWEWSGPFDAVCNENDLKVPVTLRNKYGIDTKTYAYYVHRNVYLFCRGMRIIIHNTQALSDSENSTYFTPFLRQFRKDVRAIFQKFSAGNMSVNEIKYLNISRDYEKLI